MPQTVDYVVEIVASALNIRSGPAKSFSSKGSINQGTQVNVNEVADTGYYKLADGRGYISNGNAFAKVVKNNSTAQTATKTDTTPPVVNQQIPQVETTILSAGLDKKLLDMLYATAKTNPSGSKVIDASTRLFGGPHQFISQTDFRLNTGSDFQLGRKYMQTMVSEAPIVYFMPGRPNYLPEMSDSQRSSFTQFIAGKQTDNSTILDKITGNKDYRYYSFISDYSRYMRYVNVLCRFCAIYIGIGDNYVLGTGTKPDASDGTKYKDYDWSNYRYESAFKSKDNPEHKGLFNLKELTTDMYQGLFGSYQYTQFFADPNLSFNESSSNNTTQSKVAGFFDSAEGVVKELAFLLDAGAISKDGAALQEGSKGIDAIKKQLSGKNENFFTRLLGMSSSVLSGSNMIFPQIWGDSAYNKSYNITINLVSPYGDKESVYLNCIVPMMHLLALALPRQTTANSYASPFLVRVFSKGWFSCEMGIVDSISIEKGGGGAWTIDGLPSEIKISLGIKDMYSNLMITPSSEPALFFQNFGLIDFLTVTCGVDITKPQFKLQLDAILTTLTNTLTDIPTNFIRDSIEGIKTRVEKFYKLGV